MRTLSTALNNALSGPVQRPAYLVQLDYSPVQRWSSHETVSWGGHTWTRFDITVQGLEVQALSVRGTLVAGNADDVAGAFVIAQGIQDIPITVYGYDAAATSSGDVVLLASAVGGTAEVGLSEVRVSLRHRSEFQQAPRTYVNAANGFTVLQAAGTVIRVNGQDIKLARRDR